jgi:tetratricopeptide (TPR) repeat protein
MISEVRMIRTKIGDIKNLIALMKGSQLKALRFCLLSWALVLTLVSSPASAQKSIIQSIYFNTDHSVVIETKDKSKLEFSSLQTSGNIYLLGILNTKLARGVSSKLSSRDFDIELNTDNNDVKLSLEPKSGAASTVTPKTILDGLAYELEFNAPVEAAPKWQALSSEIVSQELHQLSAELSNHKIYTITQSKSEIDKFIEGLDDSLAAAIEADTKFQEETFHKIDSASLVHLADTLVKRGHNEEALTAYRRALELNAENINAKLGLAEITQDENEKLANYLASVSDKALLEIGSSWFEQAQQSGDLKSVAKALVSFQFAVLKSPKNPEYRYRYAQALESGGADFWTQATKRYLEAAALAKTEYLAGNKAIEPLLRDATESLIRVLSTQGNFDNAAKYCAAYMNLGFKKFIDGKPVLAVLKEVEANRNPFKQEISQGIVSKKELKG